MPVRDDRRMALATPTLDLDPILNALDPEQRAAATLPDGTEAITGADLTHAADPNTPRIHWNYYKDGTASKAMHISTNPFLLRRYARRVASLWEKQYGRYPKVTALTGLALNTRPMQQTVDPNADLASVPIARFGHNPWINDLDQKRIPKMSAGPEAQFSSQELLLTEHVSVSPGETSENCATKRTVVADRRSGKIDTRVLSYYNLTTQTAL